MARPIGPAQAVAFVRRHGIVLQAARGPVPSLAHAIAGERIRGSWWGHPKGRAIFVAARAVCDSPDVLVCKLLDGKITYVHRRLWPALVKMANRFDRAGLAKIWDEHTASGAHRARRLAFPRWVPREVLADARRLSLSDAQGMLASCLPMAPPGRQSTRPTSVFAKSSPLKRRGSPDTRASA